MYITNQNTSPSLVLFVIDRSLLICVIEHLSLRKTLAWWVATLVVGPHVVGFSTVVSPV